MQMDSTKLLAQWFTNIVLMYALYPYCYKFEAMFLWSCL